MALFEPATGITAATVAVTTSAGGMALLSTLNTIPLGEFLPGTMFCVLGSIGWQMIQARTARETAAQKGVPTDKLPTVDWVSVGYGMFSAPLVAGCLIAIIHVFGGTSNLLSLGGFLLSGATGPALVGRTVSMFLAILPNKAPGGTP